MARKQRAAGATYTRAVRDYLRDEYGIRDVNWFEGGNHPRAEFWYEGRRHVLTLHRQPGGRELGPGVLNRQLAEIRHRLGPPPPKASPPPRRTLEEMTPMPSDNPPTNPPPPWSEPETIVEERPAALIGEIALYSEKKIKSSKYRLVFVSLPPEVATRFPEAVTTTRTAPDVWQLQGRPGKGARVKQLTPTHYELYGGSTAPIIEGFAAPFRAQAEFVIAGSTVTARLLRETMHPLTPPPYRGGSKPKTAAPAPQAQSASPSPPATQERLPSFGEIAGMFVPGVADMHAALIQIREIERATPYRLVKLREDGWAWRAPMITLDAG